MNFEKGLIEYRNLCATLGSLRGKFVRKKEQVRLLLEETAALRRNAFLAIAKTSRFTRHLTGQQRQIAGLSVHLGEIKARIDKSRELLRDNNVDESEVFQELREPNHLEIKKMGVLVIKMIEDIKRKLLQLELLEMRCKELIISIRKALEAFIHEAALIRRKIYPWGIFSRIYRWTRKSFGGAYFVFRDFKDLSDLGRITNLVLKIADSPLF